MQGEVLDQGGWGTDKTLVIDEATNGTLDTINIAWLGATEDMEISDVSYSRLA